MQTATAAKAGTVAGYLVWRIVLPTILACRFASTLAWICLVGYGAIVPYVTRALGPTALLLRHLCKIRQPKNPGTLPGVLF